MFICVKAYGSANLTYSLRAVPTMCPADFTAEGEQLLCSSRIGRDEQRHSGCAPDGTCQCKPPYAKPVPSVYDGARCCCCAVACCACVSEGSFLCKPAYAKPACMVCAPPPLSLQCPPCLHLQSCLALTLTLVRIQHLG